MSRCDGPPRKILLGTAISGYEIFAQPLEQRLKQIEEWLQAMSAEAQNRYPGQRLDLVVLPEYLLAHPGQGRERAVRLAAVKQRIGACAQRHGCYLIVPMVLQEEDQPLRCSNAAVLLDRQGTVAGIYRKVHLVAPLDSDEMEGGLTPGREFPVFDCDFGRLGIQICWDISFDDGWEAMARQGAEIVAFPSATPQLRRPAMYAIRHRYYIVNAAPRDNAAVLNPLGIPEAQITQPDVLVHQIDLAYAIVHWSAHLDEGRALSREFGDKVGFHYYRPEDTGIFWSNAPTLSIGQMLQRLGLTEMHVQIERTRSLQDRARGGPVVMPPRR